MTPARWGKLKELFGAATELPDAERAAFLAKIEDASLRSDLRNLLASHEKPGSFLDTVTQEFRSLAFTQSSAARRIGERIGAYRIVDVLGTGGMGDVFKAVRDDDQYRAEVAIKLMRADVSSSVVEQRFRAERQILAGLDHRNIARLLDGGTSEGGMPYVVMELVIGVPIDRFCDANKLNVRDRVQLFLQVCAAVSYAHQHLIVHRDLKPNNILVTADGSAKLLDFGIAKLLEANAHTASATEETATAMRAMTLEYASPEQVGGGAVTTVSDVYSLGVVLYRLLTGQSPYRPRTNDAERIAEILSDSTPTRPSVVERKIDEDLDNVLMMALRKEPQRRYGSVEQLANDLRNYLSGMPVQARGNSLGYRAGKFLRRRKVEIAAGVVVAGSLLGGLGFSIREARIADHQRQVAQEHFDSVRKMANTLLFEMHDEMEKAPGSTRTREMLVKTSLEYLDALYKESGSDRALQEELAAAYKKVGDIQGAQLGANTGNHAAALQSYARAIALLEPLLKETPANHRAGITLGKAYIQQGSLLLVAGAGEQAAAAVQKGVALMEALKMSITDEAERSSQLGGAYWMQADILAYVGRSAEAMTALDNSIAVCEEFWKKNPDNVDALNALSKAYNNASNHADTRLQEPARSERTIVLLKKSLRAGARLVELAPDNPNYRFDLGLTQSNLGVQMAARGDYAGALKLFESASPAVALRTSDPDDARAAYLSALVDSHFADVLFHLGRVEESRVILVKCDKTLQELVTRNGSLRTEYALGHNAVRLGALYASLAENPRSSASARLGLWHQSRDSLQRGTVLLKKVAASVALEPIDLKPVNDGVALLARAEAAIAKL